MDKHSFLLFISGFFAEIQKASNAFLAEISFSCVKIVHLISKSFPSCELFLCLPRGVIKLFRLLLARCLLNVCLTLYQFHQYILLCNRCIRVGILLPPLRSHLLCYVDTQCNYPLYIGDHKSDYGQAVSWDCRLVCQLKQHRLVAGPAKCIAGRQSWLYLK